MTYLLDTNMLSEWRKLSPDPGVEAWFSRIHLDDVFLSVVTVGEIRRGITKLYRRNDHRQAQLLESWLTTVRDRFIDRVVPVTVDIAEEWGRIDAANPLQVPDALIAATAQVHDWTLVTRNVKDFEHTGVRVLNPFVE
jgi:predicted nucleic acid-binding protein